MAWKRLVYTFEILHDPSEKFAGTLEVKANGYIEAENEVDVWLEEHPGYIMGGYTYAENALPAPQQWVIE